MTAPHAALGPAGGFRRPRRSDTHQVVLEEAGWRAVLRELSWLWTGRPMSDRRKYGSIEYRSVDQADCALHQYAANLAHGFLLPRSPCGHP